MSARPVHVIVVAFHAPDQLERCLARLDGELPVAVVDNSSCPAVATVAHRHGAVYVSSGGNVGYATAVNTGLARVVGEDVDVLLLNPDALVSATQVRQLADFLHRPDNDRVAAVAPRLRGPDGDEQRLVWPLPSPLRMCAEAIGLGRLPTRRTFLAGAVLLLRREAIEEVGRFDERFFLYAEEADWQRRSNQLGWRSAACADVVAAHIGAGTSTNIGRREALFHAGQETYIRKWYGLAGWSLYRVAACVGAGARALLLTRERRRDAARRLGIYVQGPRRRAALKPE